MSLAIVTTRASVLYSVVVIQRHVQSAEAKPKAIIYVGSVVSKPTDWPVGPLRRIGYAIMQTHPDNRPYSTERHIRVYQGKLVKTFAGYQSVHLIWADILKGQVKQEFWEWHVEFLDGTLLGPIREDYLDYPGVCGACGGYTASEDYLCLTCRSASDVEES